MAIERALISVSDKTGIVEFAQKLAENNVEILSKLLNNKTPIIPRMTDGSINLDIRSVFENQDNEIAEFLNLI